MKRSESIKELAAALVKFRKECGAIAKNAENPFFKSNYADLNNIWSKIAPHLENNGLTVIQAGESGMIVSTLLLHESGEWIESTIELPVKDASPQAGGSVLTYARRYNLSLPLGLITELDDDGEISRREKVQQDIDEVVGAAPDQTTAEIRYSVPKNKDAKGRWLCPECSKIARETELGNFECGTKGVIHWRCKKADMPKEKKDA